VKNDDSDSAALGAYIRTQLTRAAESHALHSDLDGWLEAALAAGEKNEHDGGAAADR
jgi:hypothetical protein